MTGPSTQCQGLFDKGDQSEVGLDDLVGLFQLKRFCEFKGYIFSKVFLPPSFSKLVFIGRSQATDRETVPVLPMTSGASEPT